MDPTKKEAIKKSLQQTKQRRKSQLCKVFELKVDFSRLTRSTRHSLFGLFLEGKWFRNAAIASDNLWLFDSKTKAVGVKVGASFENRPLTLLGSQIKQSLLSQIEAEIKGLSTKKKQGEKVGRLQFKSRLTSLPLKQHGVTYRLSPNGRLRLQNIKQSLRVRGMKQIPQGAEFANAKLIHKQGDFFLHVTCYLTPEQWQRHQESKARREKPATKMEALAFDLGIANQVTTSNGFFIAYPIPLSPTIRKRHQQLSKKQKGSHNQFKARERLQKAYAKTRNIKEDIINKLLALFFLFAGKVCTQDDCVKGWQRIWGRRILETSIGGLLGKLKKLPDAVIVDRFYPSSQLCPVCSHKTPHALKERTFVCAACGYSADRDVNAAKNILFESLRQIGVECSESAANPKGAARITPEDTSASMLLYEYLSQIPYLSVSRVDDSGSPSPSRLG